MIKQTKFLFQLVLMILLIHLPNLMEAQKGRKKNSSEPKETIQKIDEQNFSSLSYRHIGPFRGGRAAAVTGVPGEPNLYYMGATGGGVPGVVCGHAHHFSSHRRPRPTLGIQGGHKRFIRFRHLRLNRSLPLKRGNPRMPL
jgi:hypothetical protein